MPSKPPMPPMPSIPQMPPMPPIPSVSTLFSMPTITPMPMRANNIEVSDNKWLLPGMPFNHSSGILPPHPPMLSNMTASHPNTQVMPYVPSFLSLPNPPQNNASDICSTNNAPMNIYNPMMHAPASNNISGVTNNVANTMPHIAMPCNASDNTGSNDVFPKQIPGPKMYSRAHETTTLIVADSTIRNIHVGQLKDDISDDQKDIIIRRFPGATADEMKFFIKDSLARFCPKNLVIFGGCNDIGWADKNRKNECDIVQSILCMAEEGKKAGCQSIFVSSVLPRRGRQYERPIVYW